MLSAMEQTLLAPADGLNRNFKLIIKAPASTVALISSTA
ncbi:hypothetical protein SynBIOSE41_03786 [Synechococcus sp. BIOS-E4-1]|nr:hypothetical protein SynBIOSE41_03786 [Synechococcus sp. BIOS-E4-1]